MTREELKVNAKVRALSDFHTYAPTGTIGQIDSIKAPSYGSNEWLFSIEWFPPQHVRRIRKGSGKVLSFGLTFTSVIAGTTAFRGRIDGMKVTGRAPEKQAY